MFLLKPAALLIAILLFWMAAAGSGWMHPISYRLLALVGAVLFAWISLKLKERN